MDKKRVSAPFILALIRTIVQFIAFFAVPALFSEAFHGVKEIIEAIGQREPLEWTGFTIKLLFLCGITVLFGRIFCGWICAFGAMGDWIYAIGKRIRKQLGRKEKKLSEKWIFYLQKIKYFFLFFILVIVFFDRGDKISKYSPWDMFARILSGKISVNDMAFSGILLFLIIAGMFFYERFFCQFFCPLGAVFSFLPVNPLVQWKDKKESCIPGCGLCKKNCPVHIKPGEDSYKEAECIRCGRCISICPKKNCNMAWQTKKEQKKEIL